MPKNTEESGRRKVASILTGAIMVTAAAGLLLAHSTLRRRFSSEPHPPVKIAIQWPLHRDEHGRLVTWMSDALKQSIQRVAQANLTSDPLDAVALRLTSEALMATGWFEAPPTVARSTGGQVNILGRWRAPVAVVRSDDREWLVSAKGELLPLDFEVGGSGLKYIDRPFAPRPAAGEKWTGGDVEAALSLLGILQDTAADPQVAGIDASQYVSHKRLTIVTDQGNRVVWGAAPSDWAPAEPSRQVKLQRLLALRADPKFGGRIDASFPLIDLTSPRGVMIDRAGMAQSNPSAPPAFPAPPMSTPSLAHGPGADSPRASGLGREP